MFISMDDFIAGWMGGLVSLLIGHPMDTIKVRQQTFNTDFYTASKNTLKYEGILGLYKGMLFPIFTYGPSNSIFFGIYGTSFRVLEQKYADHSNSSINNYSNKRRIFVSGCIAGFFQTIFYSPVEYVKILLQANVDNTRVGHWGLHYELPYSRPVQAIRGIYRNRGLSGLYIGLWPMIIRDVPTGGVYMLTYEIIRNSFSDRSEYYEIINEVIAGGTAGIVSIAISLPMDVIKTRIQTDNLRQPNYNGMLDCFRKLQKSEGNRIFFKGLPVICLRAFPVHACMFLVYQHTLQLFNI